MKWGSRLVNLNTDQYQHLSFDSNNRNKSKLNCKAILVYGPFMQEKIMFYYNDKGKGKPFMDYVLVVTLMCL